MGAREMRGLQGFAVPTRRPIGEAREKKRKMDGVPVARRATRPRRQHERRPIPDVHDVKQPDAGAASWVGQLRAHR